MSFPIDTLKFDENGLIPAIVQDVNNQTVLMLGFMNRDSLLRTVSEGKVCFWSRSRQKFWLKGETSGMFLQVRSVRVNCENNSLLILAEPIGPTCHTGHESCYYREAQESGERGESGEWVEIAPVLTDPEALYGKK
ncbi:MAG: phosphoribosyl-AMP cyclohydrolase [Armatimonadetes bacterium]|nr:phosphoribosyl-AMP cyclohydrolase [Armatimonadota bacterium]